MVLRYRSCYGPHSPTRIFHLSREHCNLSRIAPPLMFTATPCQTLNLAQSHLAQEKWLEEAQARVKELEAEIAELEKRRNSEAGMTRIPRVEVETVLPLGTTTSKVSSWWFWRKWKLGFWSSFYQLFVHHGVTWKFASMDLTLASIWVDVCNGVMCAIRGSGDFPSCILPKNMGYSEIYSKIQYLRFKTYPITRRPGTRPTTKQEKVWE